MGSSWKWNEYLTVGNVMVGVRFVSGGTTTTRYFHSDHLGSISVITDRTGTVLERLSYDAWGKRRLANGADDPGLHHQREGLGNSLFPNMLSLLLLQKFPVTASREKCHRRLIFAANPPQISIPNSRKSQISLYFSLLSGNLGRRPVRIGLRRQPVSGGVRSGDMPGRGFWRLWRKLELGTTALRSYDVTRRIGARLKQRSNRRTRRNCLRSRERASAALHSGRSRDRSQDLPQGNLWSAERCHRGLP